MWYIIDMLAGFFIAALAGLGIGGGGLLVIYLTLARDMAQLPAQGLNLLFFLIASAASLFFHSRKRKMDVLLIAVLAAAGVAGALFGVRAASAIPPEIIRKCFGGLLLISGGLTLFKK